MCHCVTRFNDAKAGDILNILYYSQQILWKKQNQQCDSPSIITFQLPYLVCGIQTQVYTQPSFYRRRKSLTSVTDIQFHPRIVTIGFL